MSSATPRSGGPDLEAEGAAAVEAYARDHTALTDENERDALDYLLAPKPPRHYDVKVQFETQDGPVPLTFVIRGYDGRKIDAIESRNRNEVTGRLDQTTYDCELITEAGVWLEGATGRQMPFDSDEFLTLKFADPDDPTGQTIKTQKVAAPPVALEARFKTQLGLLMGVAQEIRSVSGYDPKRVGSAHRRLVVASGNS